MDAPEGAKSGIPNLPRALEQSPLFRAALKVDPKGLSRALQQRIYAPGEILFREGDPHGVLYVICSGRVEAVQGAFGEHPVVLGEAGAFAVIGEQDFFEDTAHLATLRAVERARVFTLAREDFEQLVGGCPELALEALRALNAALKRDAPHLENRFPDRSSRPTESTASLEQTRREPIDQILHDLRNPLNCMVGALDMLRGALPDPTLAEVDDLLVVAESSAEVMNRLVNNLLDMTRMESGLTGLNRRLIVVEALIGLAVGRMALMARQSQIALRTKVPYGLPLVMADEDKIDRVIANLVDNALKFTPAGGQVTVEASADDKEITISITDTGPGILPAWREQIFERFTQAPATAGRGFGLGLSFCQMVVTAHGGRIWVEDGPGGEGSRFAFTLPLT